jgi:hypothetical protein
MVPDVLSDQIRVNVPSVVVRALADGEPVGRLHAISGVI